MASNKELNLFSGKVEESITGDWIPVSESFAHPFFAAVGEVESGEAKIEIEISPFSNGECVLKLSESITINTSTRFALVDLNNTRKQNLVRFARAIITVSVPTEIDNLKVFLFCE